MTLYKRKVTQSQLVSEKFKHTERISSLSAECLCKMTEYRLFVSVFLYLVLIWNVIFGEVNVLGVVFQVDYMDENEEYFQRQASHRQSRRRFRKINQKGERQTIIDTVEPYPVGKPPLPRGYHTVGYTNTVLLISFVFLLGVL
jgi:hypothetical protein